MKLFSLVQQNEIIAGNGCSIRRANRRAGRLARSVERAPPGKVQSVRHGKGDLQPAVLPSEVSQRALRKF